MDKRKYIKAIEELNTEYIEFINSKFYIKQMRKKKLKYIIKHLKIKSFIRSIDLFIYNKLNKSIKSNNSYTVKNIKNGKKVVYTCIIGNYDKLLSPMIETDDTDYIVFSDNSNIAKDNTSWQYRKIDRTIIKKCNNNPILINRYIKMHPHELLKEYDLALYVDGNVQIVSDIEDCLNYINDKTGIAMHSHSKRNDVYEEAKACIKLHKGNKVNIKNLIKRYELENFPHNFGLFEATIMAIDLKNDIAKHLLEDWYIEFYNSETFRDQLIFTYILWKTNFKFKDVGILGINVSRNPKFRLLKHNPKKK